MNNTTLEQQVLESWRVHNRIMQYVLDEIPEEALAATLSTRGGKGIGGQFAHLHMVRYWKLEALQKNLIKELPKFEKGADPNKEQLQKALAESAAAMEKYFEYALENDGNIKHFKYKAIPLMAYFVGHESHHRGNIYLTMKKSGFKLTDNLKWNIWDWNKFRDIGPGDLADDMDEE